MQKAAYEVALARILRQRGGTMLSRGYRKAFENLRVRCAKGHVFQRCPAHLVRGDWCPTCRAAELAELRRARGQAKLEKVVASRGGVLLPPGYVSLSTRVRVRCARGHEWSATAAALRSGNWCRVCAHERLRTRTPEAPAIRPRSTAAARERARRLVARVGGRLLAPGYVNGRTPLRIRCPRGHTWGSLPGDLHSGRTCPHCASDRRLAEAAAMAERHGGECLSTSCPSSTSVLEWRCVAGHRFRKAAGLVRRGSWCRTCRSAPVGSIEAMIAIAKDRGGACLSARYAGAVGHLRWRCAEGHEWRATPAETWKGHWCAICGWGRSYSRARLSLEDMKRTAAERGGKCLSTAYFGNKVRLKWRCARGHTWMAHPNRVRQGSWCPVCSLAFVSTLEGMRALAIERGGRCLSKTWLDHSRPLRFECGRGHRFEVVAKVLKTGIWCPRCSKSGVRAGAAGRSA